MPNGRSPRTGAGKLRRPRLNAMAGTGEPGVVIYRRDGFTIAVSANNHIAPIARRTVLSDNALSALMPVLEDLTG
jgi:hypothetical protein